MNALVAVASKHGSTREIGAWIADVLRARGIAVELVDADRVAGVAPYGAVVVGSGVYMGRWLGPARDLVTRDAEALRARPAWLFSSGPLGVGIDDDADATEGLRLLELVGGRGHRVFAGRAVREEMGFGERAILRMVKQPYGDHRDRAAVEAWAASIAEALAPAPATPR